MSLLKYISLTLLVFISVSCTEHQVKQVIGTLGESNELTSSEVGSGLKEALIKGITIGANNASKQDGYFKNSLIKIPFPQDLIKVKNTLNDLGLNKLVSDFELSLNRAAEKGATKAAPIFVSAIKKMTIQDAWSILKGDQHSATNFLKKATSQELTTAFKPIVKNSLDEVNATKYFTQMITRYNQIPLVKKLNPNLEDYATEKAIDGLFVMVEKEEEKIREDPAARTTALLQKVFNKDNWK